MSSEMSEVVDYDDLPETVVGLRVKGFKINFGAMRKARRAGVIFERIENGKGYVMVVPKYHFDQWLIKEMGLSKSDFDIQIAGRQAHISPRERYRFHM